MDAHRCVSPRLLFQRVHLLALSPAWLWAAGVKLSTLTHSSSGQLTVGCAVQREGVAQARVILAVELVRVAPDALDGLPAAVLSPVAAIPLQLAAHLLCHPRKQVVDVCTVAA